MLRADESEGSNWRKRKLMIKLNLGGKESVARDAALTFTLSHGRRVSDVSWRGCDSKRSLRFQIYSIHILANIQVSAC